MMRIAVRGEDGTAKALKGNNLGQPEVVSRGIEKNILESIENIQAGSSYESERFDSNGYNYVKATIATTQPRTLRVYVRHFYGPSSETSNTDGYELVYETNERLFLHNIEFPISGHFQIKIENNDELVATLSSKSKMLLFVQTTPLIQTIQTADALDVYNKAYQRKLFTTNQSLVASESLETKRFSSDGFNYAKTTIALTVPRIIRVSIREFYAGSGESNNTDGYRVIYESSEPKFLHTFEYPINLMYQLKIENIDTLGTSISEHSTEIRFLDRKIKENGTEGNNHEVKVVTENTKTPKGLLKFKKSPITARRITLGHDNYFYVVDENHVFYKYEDIKTDTEPLETGITWDTTSNANIEDIIAFEDSIVVFTNAGGQARIYQMDSINDTPTLVYESNTVNSTYWNGRSAFGIKSYDNGLGQYVLAGCYGRDPAARDLLLSSDGGRTFNVIKKTSNNDTTVNSHWHDVAFDPYHGYIWASEGDGVNNRGVHFSDDWGSTWYTLTPLGTHQPTSIIPFPERMVFGRDSYGTGIDYYTKPTLATDYDFGENEIKPLKEFKNSNSSAYQYYGNGEVHDGSEGYMSFSIFPDQNPKLIAGTGDGGKSFHFLFMGDNNNSKVIHTFFGIDKEYVYAYGYDGALYFAERVEWE